MPTLLEIKKIGILCHWFNINDCGKLMMIEMDVHGYLPIQQYRATIPSPEVIQTGLSLDTNV